MRHRVVIGWPWLWLTVTATSAGRKNTYNVHRVGLTGQCTTTVIGRELPAVDARRVIKNDKETIR